MKYSIFQSKETENACNTDVLNTSCLIIPFSSLSWKNLFHGLCNEEGKRQKRTNNNLVYLWIRGGDASNPRGFQSSTAGDLLKKIV